jgi:regulatory protein
VPQVIRSITQVRQGPLVELQLDGGERLRVHQRRVAALLLRAGGELPAGARHQLTRLADVDRCEQRALRLIALRGRSTAELDRRLRGWGLSGEEAGEIVERLERLGLVDDAALAVETSAVLRRRGHGHRRAAAELERLAVSDGLRRQTVREHADTDLERARTVVEARFGPPPYDLAVQRRAAGLLARRGFDEDTVMAAVGAEPPSA